MLSEPRNDDAGGISLFLVEDDELDYRLLLRQFTRQNREVAPRWCTNCRDAIATFRTDVFDAVVTDLNIPEGSGVDLVRYVRSLDGAIPIIVLTGNGSEDAAVEAIRQGADDYLVKGTDSFARLPAQVSRLVTAYRSEKSRQQTTAELRLLQEQFRDFAEAASDWFWEKGPNLKFTFVSAAVEDILGVPPTYFLGKTIWEVIEDNRPATWQAHEQDVRNHLSFRDFVYQMPGRDGTQRTVRISGKAVFSADGVFTGYRGIGSDITDEVENAMRLREAVDAANEANKAKSRFLAVMSHEFRTPLNAIIGFTDGLLCGIAGALSEKQREYLTDVRSAGEHMLDLVRDVLDLSRIEADRYDLELKALSLQEEVDIAVSLLASAAAKAEVAINIADIDPDMRIQADSRALNQILTNILSNAVKFTSPGGAITLSCRVTDDEVEISIRDTGVGIPDDKLGDVILPFHQLDNVLARKHEGTGLGLAIAKGLIEAHGGSIVICSKLGIGTEVRLSFPQDAALSQV